MLIESKRRDNDISSMVQAGRKWQKLTPPTATVLVSFVAVLEPPHVLESYKNRSANKP